MSPTYGYLEHGDLLFLALIALALVLKNLWDFARYNFEHVANAIPRLTAHPLQGVAAVASRALAAAAFPHATRTAPRPMVRRRPTALAVRVRRLPLREQQA